MSPLPSTAQALLAQLRYPRTPECHGVAAWGLNESTAAGLRRTHAWVKWDGEQIQALLTDTPPDGQDQVVSLHWRVAPAGGAATVLHARDHAGAMETSQALRTFAQALARLGCPSFVPYAAPRVLSRPARRAP